MFNQRGLFVFTAAVLLGSVAFMVPIMFGVPGATPERQTFIFLDHDADTAPNCSYRLFGTIEWNRCTFIWPSQPDSPGLLNTNLVVPTGSEVKLTFKNQ